MNMLNSNKDQPLVSNSQRHLGRSYLPKSVGGGAFNVIEQFSETLISDAVVLNNGEYATHTITTQSADKNLIMASVEWAVFVSADSSFALGEALVPYLTGISSLTLSQWTIIGPYKSALETITDATNGNSTPGGTDSERMTVINVSAGASKTLWFVNQIKYIVNGGGGGGS